jgi:hypothetical protein
MEVTRTDVSMQWALPPGNVLGVLLVMPSVVLSVANLRRLAVREPETVRLVFSKAGLAIGLQGPEHVDVPDNTWQSLLARDRDGYHRLRTKVLLQQRDIRFRWSRYPLLEFRVRRGEVGDTLLSFSGGGLCMNEQVDQVALDLMTEIETRPAFDIAMMQDQYIPPTLPPSVSVSVLVPERKTLNIFASFKLLFTINWEADHNTIDEYVPVTRDYPAHIVFTLDTTKSWLHQKLIEYGTADEKAWARVYRDGYLRVGGLRSFEDLAQILVPLYTHISANFYVESDEVPDFSDLFETN